jgi:hypothetical protein
MPLAPGDVRKATLVQLRAARTAMMSTEWAENFKTLPVPQQQDAHRLLFQVHLAILEMENARLADIRDKLVANEKALGEGIASLKDSLKKIQKIAAAIKAISEFLVIVGRVVKLVAKA